MGRAGLYYPGDTILRAIVSHLTGSATSMRGPSLGSARAVRMGRFAYLLATMSGERHSDGDLLARAALGLWELDDLPGFRVGVLSLLRELVGCELASYNEIAPSTGEVFILADPSDSLNVAVEMREAFAEFALQNPLAAHSARTGEMRALRLSDFVSRRELHALDLYQHVYRHIGAEHQLAFTVPTRGQIVGITLNRSTHDFDERELALLQRARALVIRAYRNLYDRARLDALLRASDGAQTTPAVFMIEQSGLLAPVDDRSERLRRRLCSEPGTIEALRDWARLQRRGRYERSAPPQLELAECGLRAIYLHGVPGGLDAIAIYPHSAGRPEELRALGLTHRQAEVLHLLWRGVANADIAAALSISEHTVRHHLEDIYRRLGVSSRAAAAHAATQAFFRDEKRSHGAARAPADAL